MIYILGIIITFITVSIFPILVSAIGSLFAMLPAIIIGAIGNLFTMLPALIARVIPLVIVKGIPLIITMVLNRIRNKAIFYIVSFVIVYNIMGYIFEK